MSRRPARTAVPVNQATDPADPLPKRDAPLALNGVLGDIDQHNVLATVRGSEVQADPTTALTLEAALRRRGDDPAVRLCTCHRVLRLQRFDAPDAWQHFRLFALVTAG